MILKRILSLALLASPFMQSYASADTVADMAEEAILSDVDTEAVYHMFAPQPHQSAVMNRGAQEQIITELQTKNKNLTLEFDGKYRIDMMQYGVNNRLLNSCNGGLDKYIVPGKHTFDFGIGVGFGKATHGRDIINLGCDLRNRSVWGNSQQGIATTSEAIKDGEYVFGSHSHRIGLPALYVRGVDLTLDLKALYDAKWNSDHYFKLGLFPFEVGRGISLGAAYAVQPDFIAYDPIDTIQEYAAGFMVYGSNTQKNLDYKAYVGMLSNKSGAFSDVNERIRGQQYGHKQNQARGFGVMNVVSAFAVDWKYATDDLAKVTFSPYIVYLHNGEEKVDFTGDARSNLATLGINSESSFGDHTFGWEFALNTGTQRVYGVDRNIVTRESRDSILTLQGVPLLVNSHVIYNGGVVRTPPVTNDVIDKKAVYLAGDPRQTAIDNVVQNASYNDQVISPINDTSGTPQSTTIDLQNAPNRFRDPYINHLQGFMGVMDYSYNFSLWDGVEMKGSWAAGLASGDRNPNKSELKTDDYAKNGTYNGFIGIQEIYTGKEVKSVFLLSGVGKIPRILAVPARSSDSATASYIDYPSSVSRFTNLAYTGGSLQCKFESDNFKWKVHPNVLVYWQPVTPKIFDTVFADQLQARRGKRDVSPFLGTELNMFLEARPTNFEGVQFYATVTMFIPGSYYKDISGLPLNKAQQKFLDRADKSGETSEYVPVMGSSTAFYGMFGVEYRF